MNGAPDSDIAYLANITGMCEAFNCLPKPGGLFDQDVVLIEGMRIVKQAKSERERKDAEAQQADIKRKSNGK